MARDKRRHSKQKPTPAATLKARAAATARSRPSEPDKPDKPKKRRPHGPARPRYQEIHAELMAKIQSGGFAVGDRLPTEHQLCERYRVSRFTVRQALRELRDLGLIERRAGIGSIVIADNPREAFVQSLTSIDELLRYPPETFRKEIARRHIFATPEQARHLHCAQGQEWVRTSSIRLAPGVEQPISWTDFYLQPRFEAVFDHPNPKNEPVYKQIEDAFGHLAKATRVEIFAGCITEELSQPMQIAEGTPALNMIRRYTGEDGETFLVTYTVHPEDRFVFTVDLVQRWEPGRG